jgi:agmatine deiminase
MFQYAEARAALLPSDAAAAATGQPNVRVVRMPHDDSWLRDTAPTFVHARVRAPCPAPQPPPLLMATDWRFNGWGDLYGSYERDKGVARQIAEELAVPRVEVDMVLEGGSIHVDGEG